MRLPVGVVIASLTFLASGDSALREAGLEQDVVHLDYVDFVLPRQIAEPDSLGAGGDD
jgi:hypothetical protein